MIIVRNNIIPFSGFKAMSFWPFIFVRKDCSFNKVDERHEMIHCRQQVEMMIVGAAIGAILFTLADCGWWSLLSLLFFYVWYITEWIIRLFIDKNPYRSISFEQEAYGNEEDPDYLKNRKHFAWVKYLVTS